MFAKFVTGDSDTSVRCIKVTDFKETIGFAVKGAFKDTVINDIVVIGTKYLSKRKITFLKNQLKFLSKNTNVVIVDSNDDTILDADIIIMNGEFNYEEYIDIISLMKADAIFVFIDEKVYKNIKKSLDVKNKKNIVFFEPKPRNVSVSIIQKLSLNIMDIIFSLCIPLGFQIIYEKAS
jgi:hypothetical protein